MPAIKSLTEFNRNQNAVIEQLEATGEPLYLTRNGAACVVVMDAAAFDEAMALRDGIREQELRTYRDILRGAEQIAAGQGVEASEADALIRAQKGWR